MQATDLRRPDEALRPARHLDVLLVDPPDVPRLSFHDYMDVAMFDPQVGYYGAGRVAFGANRDYWTFAQRLSPFFGECLARRVIDVWRQHRPAHPPGAPFRVVEIGGGEGQLLRDVHCALLATREDPIVAELLEVADWVAVDRSAALLESQRSAQAGLTVRHVQASADSIAHALPGPFFGVVVTNELLDQLSVDVLRVGPGRCDRLMIAPWLDPTFADLTVAAPPGARPAAVPAPMNPLGASRLPDLLARLQADPPRLHGFGARESVRWTGWWEPAPADPHLTRYLAHLRPELARRDALGAGDASLTWAPAMPGVLESVAELLARGAGAFFALDYGGTTRHLLDGESRFPHLRTYGGRQAFDAGGQAPPEHDPFLAPGAQDITSDVDFGWITRLAADAGLGLAFYGHQGAIEAGIDLWDDHHRRALIRARHAEGLRGMEAGKAAWELVQSLRSGGGFHLWIGCTAGLEPAFGELGSGDPLDATLEVWPELDRPRFRATAAAALLQTGVEPDQADMLAARADAALHPTGGVVDDLTDVGLYRWRGALVDALVQLRR